MNRLKLAALAVFILSSFAQAAVEDLEKKINLTLDKKAEIELELHRTDESVKNLESLIRDKRKVLLKRTRALSYLKNFKWGSILSADDPSLFERNMKIMARINKFDLQLFKDYKSAIRNLAQGRADLLVYSKELETIVSALKKQEADLFADEESRSQRMALENQRSLLHIKGRLPTPVTGKLKMGFGSFRDHQNEYAFLVRGLLLTTPTKATVISVASGKIIFRDQIPYWGEALIIQHDDNYYSVYAGIQTQGQINDSVQMSDVVAVTHGEEFYFELRHFDNPINPKNWLKEKL